MVPIVRAVQFHKFMGTGRTIPMLCGCEDSDGNSAGDYVVKLRGGIERGFTGLVSELVASRLANYFEIPIPAAALALIDREFAALIAAAQPSQSRRLEGSIGLNFGSRQLNDMMTWPVDKSIPEAMWETAVNIFAFDALIQNPDRRFSPNPNLFSRGDEVFVYDHELAFTFIEDIFPSPTPWRLDGCRYLSDHVFYKRLKGRPIDLTRFGTLLARLRDAALPDIVAEVPAEWNNGELKKITAHLLAVAERTAEFAEEIRRRLA